MTAYLKGEDVWALIKDELEERKAYNAGKIPESVAVASSSEAAVQQTLESEDPSLEKSILKYQELSGKWKDKPKKKDWQKTNYQAILILLSIISTSDQQAVEELEYAGDI